MEFSLDIPIAPIGVPDLCINEVKLNLLLDPSQKVCPRDPLLMVQMSVSPKWFATGEAIAHLKYLKEKGILRAELRGPRKVFSLNRNRAI